MVAAPGQPQSSTGRVVELRWIGLPDRQVVALGLQLAADGIELVLAMRRIPLREFHAHGLLAPGLAVGLTNRPRPPSLR